MTKSVEEEGENRQEANLNAYVKALEGYLIDDKAITYMYKIAHEKAKLLSINKYF